MSSLTIYDGTGRCRPGPRVYAVFASHHGDWRSGGYPGDRYGVRHLESARSNVYPGPQRERIGVASRYARRLELCADGCAPLGLLAADGADVASKPIAARRGCHQRSGREDFQAHSGANRDEISLWYANELSAADGRCTGVGVSKGDAAVGERYVEISIRRNGLPQVRIRKRESHRRTVNVRFRDVPDAARHRYAWRESSMLANARRIVCQEALVSPGRLQNDFRGYPVYRLVAAYSAAVSAHAVLTVI